MPQPHSRNWTRLTPEERVALVLRAQSGNRAAKDRLVRASRRTVRAIARRYKGRGLPFEDLVDEGLLGVLRAIPLYDPGRGIDFMNFAAWRIRSAIGHGLNDESRTVRLPGYLAEKVPRVQRAIAALRQRLGRDPTPEEVSGELRPPSEEEAAATLARKLGRAPNDREVRRALRRRPVTAEVAARVMEYLECFPPERPLRSIRREEELPPAAVPDDSGAEMDAAVLRQTMERSLGLLEPREELVLRLRWGIAGGPGSAAGSILGEDARSGNRLTLQQVGDHLLLTRERVRQIEREAFGRLERLLRRRGEEL